MPKYSTNYVKYIETNVESVNNDMKPSNKESYLNENNVYDILSTFKYNNLEKLKIDDQLEFSNDINVKE